jgi:hypothetical protein
MKNTFENFDLDSALDFLDKVKDISSIDVRRIPGKKFKKVHSKKVKNIK